MNNELQPIDPALYARAPTFTLEGGIALARTLSAACPKNAGAPVKKAAKKLSGATDKAQIALAKRQSALGQISQEESRLIDQRGDNSWGALRDRLEAYSILPAKEYPDAIRASELLVLLFADSGLLFVKESYPVQWSTADTILKRIQDQNLKTDIDRIAGIEFLANIQKRHAEYGAMVQRMFTKSSGDSVNLSDEVRALGRAMVAYAMQVCSAADDEDSSAEMIAMAREALRPLDIFREDAAKRLTKPSAEPGEGGPSASTEAPGSA